MVRVREGDLDPVPLERAALVPGESRILGEPLRREPAAQLDDRDHGAVEALGQVDGLADVVVVAVRERDQVDALGLPLALRAVRVLQPGVDVDPLPSGRVDSEGRVADLLAQASDAGYLAGISLGPWYPNLADCFLVSVTEKRTKAEVDGLAEVLSARCDSIARTARQMSRAIT